MRQHGVQRDKTKRFFIIPAKIVSRRFPDDTTKGLFVPKFQKANDSQITPPFLKYFQF